MVVVLVWSKSDLASVFQLSGSLRGEVAVWTVRGAGVGPEVGWKRGGGGQGGMRTSLCRCRASGSGIWRFTYIIIICGTGGNRNYIL